MKENKEVHEQLVHTNKQKRLFEVKLRATQHEIKLAIKNAQNQVIEDVKQSQTTRTQEINQQKEVEVAKNQETTHELSEDEEGRSPLIFL